MIVNHFTNPTFIGGHVGNTLRFPLRCAVYTIVPEGDDYDNRIRGSFLRNTYIRIESAEHNGRWFYANFVYLRLDNWDHAWISTFVLMGAGFQH